MDYKKQYIKYKTNYLYLKSNIGGAKVVEKPSVIDNALMENSIDAKKIISYLKSNQIPKEIQHNTWKYETLKKCYFVGHLNTDLDSVAGAIGAADLFSGTPCLSENKINTEIKWALKRWGFKLNDIIVINKVKKLADKKICLIDHNNESQTPKCVDPEQIVGIIDHHKIGINTSNPIVCDIRPWGSACSIIAHTYMRNMHKISKNIAGILMSAILSDTLNLKSITTTKYDELSVAVLSKICGVTDINKYAQTQFREKSKMIDIYSVPELVLGDEKNFNFPPRVSNGIFGWATLECISEAVPKIMKKRKELLIECRAVKKDKKLDFLFLSIVDITNRNSKLLICDYLEKEIAEKAFGGKVNDKSILDLGNLVSRKKEFIPAIEKVIKNKQFAEHVKKISLEISKRDSKINYGKLVFDTNKGCSGQLVRKKKY
jgi:manganese-dependent inorganic pyrophosphatase